MYPFSDDPYSPLVRHNGIYIGCYFDMGESPIGILDPVDAAAQCVQDNIVESLTSRRGGFPATQGATVKYPLRYDGRKIFFNRTERILSGGLEVVSVISARMSQTLHVEPEQRRAAEQDGLKAHFNPIKGDFDIAVVNTFNAPDTCE